MQVGHHRLKTLAFFGKLLRDKGETEVWGRGEGFWGEEGGVNSALESIGVEGEEWTQKNKDHEVSHKVMDVHQKLESC